MSILKNRFSGLTELAPQLVIHEPLTRVRNQFQPEKRWKTLHQFFVDTPELTFIA